MTEKREEVIERYKNLIKTIGPGFHPDTPFEDYEPPLQMSQVEFEMILDDVFELETCDPYGIGLDIGYEEGWWPNATPEV